MSEKPTPLWSFPELARAGTKMTAGQCKRFSVAGIVPPEAETILKTSLKKALPEAKFAVKREEGDIFELTRLE